MSRTSAVRFATYLASVVCFCGLLVSTAAAHPEQAGYQPVTFNIPAELPDAEAGSAYSYALGGDASGGTGPPYDFNFKGAGRRPAGIQLSTTSGLLSGKTSAKPGTYGFTVCATGRKRPARGSAPGNTACDSTRIAVVKGNTPPPPPPKPACTSFVLAAAPPGVNVDIDGSSKTTVISATWQQNGCNGKVTFSTVGSPPTGLSISFLDPPAGTNGTTLSFAAAQDAKEGNYQVAILGTSNGVKAQTEVTVTINEPDFSGTYSGTWNGSFASSQDSCVMSEGGRFTVTVVKSLPSGYSATFTFPGRITGWQTPACTVTDTTTDVFVENASYSNGKVVGPTFTIAGNSLFGKRVDTYPGGTDTTSFMAQR